MNKINDLIKNGDIIVIGITGGVGSGKSLVLDYVREAYNAIVYQADQIGHKVMLPGTNAYRDIVSYFGNTILNTDNTINRASLGKIVFNNEEKLSYLNSIIHPAVMEYIVTSIINEHTKTGRKLFFIEAALLVETGYKEICNELWYVYANVDTRIKRLMDNRKYTKEKCLSIMNNQLSDDEFKSNCDFILDNENDFNITKNEIEKHMNFCYNYNID